MKVCLISPDEPRNRQKFISIPLSAGNHEVTVIKTKPSASFLFHLAYSLLRNKPDVVVFIGAGLKVLLALGLVKSSRVAFTARLGGDRLKDLDSVAKSAWDDGRYLLWLKFRFEKGIARIFLRQMHTVILVNAALSSQVSKQLSTPNRVFIIPQFCEGPAVIKHYEIQTPVEILTVSNFIFSEKAGGIIWLIEQLNQFVRGSGLAIRFRVAGGGLHLKDIKKYVDSLTISPLLSVELAGFVTDLNSYYRKADLFLYHSFHDATPNVILESKRYALPLLINECDQFSSIVEHGVSGLLYPDKTRFAEFLKELLTNIGIRKKLGQGALRDHESRFSMHASQRKIEAAFLDIMTR
ncbi:MAG: hypothetical protein DRR42_25215 [Gammaproteobacteria bacterium]|nr:MAG: hypothetical protein DRR42_25215 [Gammaproteobacteria bacterium]